MGGEALRDAAYNVRTVLIHQAQLMSYLKATGLRLGFVIHFDVPRPKEGICRVVV